MPGEAEEWSMIERVVVATDGSESVTRAVEVAVDLAERFEADIHALYVVDAGELESAPEELESEMRTALEDRAEDAIEDVAAQTEHEVTAAVRTGRPANEVIQYARDVDADIIATGTRGRHGENRFLIGSVAERVVRASPVPVLTVRQLT